MSHQSISNTLPRHDANMLLCRLHGFPNHLYIWLRCDSVIQQQLEAYQQKRQSDVLQNVRRTEELKAKAK